MFHRANCLLSYWSLLFQCYQCPIPSFFSDCHLLKQAYFHHRLALIPSLGRLELLLHSFWWVETYILFNRMGIPFPLESQTYIIRLSCGKGSKNPNSSYLKLGTLNGHSAGMGKMGRQIMRGILFVSILYQLRRWGREHCGKDVDHVQEQGVEQPWLTAAMTQEPQFHSQGTDTIVDKLWSGCFSRTTRLQPD